RRFSTGSKTLRTRMIFLTPCVPKSGEQKFMFLPRKGKSRHYHPVPHLWTLHTEITHRSDIVPSVHVSMLCSCSQLTCSTTSTLLSSLLTKMIMLAPHKTGLDSCVQAEHAIAYATGSRRIAETR